MVGTATNTASNRRIERLQTVMERTGMGRSWIYREIAAGRFPAPLKFSRAAGWDSLAVGAWIDAQVAKYGPQKDG
jgi:prophage regulatory protein